MDENGERMSKEQAIAKIKDSEDKITETFKWNYNIDSVTFASDGGSGMRQSKVLPEVALYPMGGIAIEGYVNNNVGNYFSYQLDQSGNPDYANGGLGSLLKNPSPLPDGKYDTPESYFLQHEDIQELKKQGFNSDITFEEIKDYFQNIKGKES